MLVSSLTHDMEVKIRLGFEQMNEALKARAEQACL